MASERWTSAILDPLLETTVLMRKSLSAVCALGLVSFSLAGSELLAQRAQRPSLFVREDWTFAAGQMCWREGGNWWDAIVPSCDHSIVSPRSMNDWFRRESRPY